MLRCQPCADLKPVMHCIVRGLFSLFIFSHSAGGNLALVLVVVGNVDWLVIIGTRESVVRKSISDVGLSTMSTSILFQGQCLTVIFQYIHISVNVVLVACTLLGILVSHCWP